MIIIIIIITNGLIYKISYDFRKIISSLSVIG